MLKLILTEDSLARDALDKNVDVEDILALDVKEKIGRSKYIEEKDLDEFDGIEQELRKEFAELIG